MKEKLTFKYRLKYLLILFSFWLIIPLGLLLRISLSEVIILASIASITVSMVVLSITLDRFDLDWLPNAVVVNVIVSCFAILYASLVMK